MIPTKGGWPLLGNCLDSLRPTLSPRDEVIVAVDGNSPEAVRRLKAYPWVKVVSTETTKGPAAAKNAGAASASRELIAFLDDDVLVYGHWLERLEQALVETGAVGVGPVSPWGPLSQMVGPLPCRLDDLRAFKEVAGSWGRRWRTDTGEMQRARAWTSDSEAGSARTSRTQTGGSSEESTESPYMAVGSLGGFCLLVEGQAFHDVGGFDDDWGFMAYEDEDLCERLVGSGGSLVVARDTLVHHRGGPTLRALGFSHYEWHARGAVKFEERHGQLPSRAREPLLSACLIVKDEHEMLPECLESLRGIADEVVVYDTGSTDDTVEIAITMGAIVERGYWDGDFARARNAALKLCTGRWVIWVDADERWMEPSRDALEKILFDSPFGQDAYLVPIENVMGTVAEQTSFHEAARLFRRGRCKWSGRLHEELVSEVDGGSIAGSRLGGGRIMHLGYMNSVMAAKGKARRNLGVLEEKISLEDPSQADSGDVLSFARSLMMAQRMEEAVWHAKCSFERTKFPRQKRLAAVTVIRGLERMFQWEEVGVWLEKLESAGGQPPLINAYRAHMLLGLFRVEEAIEAFESLPEHFVDQDGWEADRRTEAPWHAEALWYAGRPGDAADLLLGTLSSTKSLDHHLAWLVRSLEEAGRDLGELARVIPSEKAQWFFAQVLQMENSMADRVLEACWREFEESNYVLASAATLGMRLPLDRALVWSGRIRAAGHAEACPLLAQAGQEERPIDQRARAAAAALRAFQDARGETALREMAAKATEAQRKELLAVLAPMVAGPPGDNEPAGPCAQDERIEIGERTRHVDATVAR